jgi:hypothetical protein
MRRRRRSEDNIKRILKETVGMVRTEFMWLRIVTTSGFLRTWEVSYLAINEHEIKSMLQIRKYDPKKAYLPGNGVCRSQF